MATVVSPYTVLVLQTIGILAGAAVLVMLVPAVRRRAAIPTAVALLLTVIAVHQLWAASGSFEVVRARLSTLAPGIGEREKCLVDGANNEIVPFARWIAARVPPDEDFHYVSSSFDRPCLQFALLPRRMVSPPERARYTVYADPQDSHSKRLLARQWRLRPERRTLEFYARDFALERHG